MKRRLAGRGRSVAAQFLRPLEDRAQVERKTVLGLAEGLHIGPVLLSADDFQDPAARAGFTVLQRLGALEHPFASVQDLKGEMILAGQELHWSVLVATDFPANSEEVRRLLARVALGDPS